MHETNLQLAVHTANARILHNRHYLSGTHAVDGWMSAYRLQFRLADVTIQADMMLLSNV